MSVAVHHVVFFPITRHASLLSRLYLIHSGTVCVLVLFLCGAELENAPTSPRFASYDRA